MGASDPAGRVVPGVLLTDDTPSMTVAITLPEPCVILAVLCHDLQVDVLDRNRTCPTKPSRLNHLLPIPAPRM